MSSPMNEDASVKTPKASQIKRYQRALHEFMETHYSKTYALNHEFTEEELLSVTPESIIRWMSKKICGDENADMLHGEIPTPVRCSHHVLDFYKKSISYFMPNKGMAWDPETKRGNPTRSKDLSNLIKKVKEVGDATEGDQKKRKRESTGAASSATTASFSSPSLEVPQLTIPTIFPNTVTAPLGTAPEPTNILRRIVAQNSQFIELFGALSQTLTQFQSSLRVNNQQILAEINALGSAAADSPQRRNAKKRQTDASGDMAV